MRCVVAGGAGFLGSWLCNRLLEAGHEVLCLDNFFCGNLRNIARLRKNPRFALIHHDIRNPLLHLATGVDRIYNLAAPASPPRYQKDPAFTLETCITGTKQLLEAAQQNGARLLQTSTSEVYGDPAEHPQKETYWGHVNPIGIRACYDEGKRAAETLLTIAQQQQLAEIRIARIFNTYGPHMDVEDGRAVSNFAVQALKRNPITIYGDGSHTRSFCYVSDMIDGLIELMEHPTQLGPVNLGNPTEYTLLELATQIKTLADSSSPIVHLPTAQDDPQRRQPDISLAKNTLGWHPQVPLKEGLAASIAYFKQVLDASL